MREPTPRLDRGEEIDEGCVDGGGFLAGDRMAGARDHAQRRLRRPAFQEQAAVEAGLVLVADDDVSVRAVLVAALEAIGDEVDTLNTPGSCDAHPDLASFDVVILDAGGGGIEALARLRARGVGVPVLVASGEEIALRPDPLTRFLLKPFPLKSLDRELAALSALKIRA